MAKSDDRPREEFTAEAEELLDVLSADLQDLDGQADGARPELINKIFRELHTLKGLAGMFGVATVAELAHKLEDTLDRVRMGRLAVSRELINVLYDALDVLQRLAASVRDPPAAVLANAGALLGRIARIAAAPDESQKASFLDGLELDEQTRNSLTEYEEHRLKENVRGGKAIYLVEQRFEFSDFDQKLKDLSKRLSDAGEVISTLPAVDPKGTGIAFRLLYGSEADAPAVGALAPEAHVRLLKSASAPAALRRQPADEASLRSASSTVRVDISKLDDLLNVVGELQILQAQLETAGGDDDALAKVMRGLRRKLDELQSLVLGTRLVPVGQIYAKLGRTVRQIARELGKEVELVLRGEETELDKMIVEEISDPLLHLIRNAIDHGIESPKDRAAAGKPRAGNLTMLAYQQGSSVVLEISDDGRGIDPQAIRKTAIKRGLIDRGETVDATRAYELLFEPGFSTASEVSEISGRGVGLDVVRKNLADLKGSIEVRSTPGRGSTFRVTLPITLAIMQTLIVRGGGQQFAIPLSAIEETVRTRTDDIHPDGRRFIMRLRNLTLPVVRLATVFALDAHSGQNGKAFVVVARSGEKTVGIVVDELVRQQDLVIKSVGAPLKRNAAIAGVAELGEGKLILIVDAASLVERFGDRHAGVATEPIRG